MSYNPANNRKSTGLSPIVVLSQGKQNHQVEGSNDNLGVGSGILEDLAEQDSILSSYNNREKVQQS